MADSEHKKELRGVARSIDALFAEPGGEPASPTDPPPEPTPAAAPRRSKAGTVADAAALTAALDRFLATGPLERDGRAGEIRELGASLREAGALDPLADAVERLMLAGEPSDAACVALARGLVSPGVASRLVHRLGLERDEVRRAELIELCRRIGREMALAVADALSDTSDRFARRAYMDAMVAMGPDGLQVTEQMVEDGRWFVVRNAVAILGEVGGDRSVELITSALAHTEAKVRREALLALAKVGGEDAGLLVHGMLEDSDPDVRLAAAMAAGALKVERALKPLLAILEDESNPDVTAAIIRALGQLGDPGAVHAIERHAVGTFFYRPPADVRIAAYRALHHIGTPHAKRLLNQAIDDKDTEIKSAVRQLVGMR